MMKRLASLLITITLCIALCAQGATVSALASEVTFSLSCTEGNVGDTVTVSVSITGDSGLTNATTYLHYNTAAVEFVKEGVGAAATSSNAMFLANNMPDEGYVKGGYIAFYPAADAGVLLTFEFKVKAYTAAGFSLSFDECQGEDESGNTFDLNYKTTTCVLNGTADTTAPTKATTTKGNTAKTTTSAKTTAPTDGQGTAVTTAPTKVTTATTYPTDTHGITLTPEVVTQSDGNAVTEADGAVVTITTTSTTAASAATSSTDEQAGDPATEKTNNWLMLIIVVGIVLLVAGGVTAVMLVMRKKKRDN